MNKLLDLVNFHAAFGRGLDHLRSLLLLGTRLWVSWQFLKSGWLKLTGWDSTLELFRSEYQVPVLPPFLAAVGGTFGELFFPILLILGVFTRFGATRAVRRQCNGRRFLLARVRRRRLRSGARPARALGLYARGRRPVRQRCHFPGRVAREALGSTLPADDSRQRLWGRLNLLTAHGHAPQGWGAVSLSRGSANA